MRGHSGLLGNKFEVISGLAYLDNRCNVGSFVSFLKVIVDTGDVLRARAVMLGILASIQVVCSAAIRVGKEMTMDSR